VEKMPEKYYRFLGQAEVQREAEPLPPAVVGEQALAAAVAEKGNVRMS